MTGKKVKGNKKLETEDDGNGDGDGDGDGPIVRHTLKSAFITGGSGFVGQTLIADLVAKNVTVYALARSERTVKLLKSLGAIPVHGDLTKIKEMEQGMKDCDTVFHCASSIGVWGEGATSLYDDNVVGTENVLQAAQGSGKVKRFIYVGSITAIFDGHDMLYADESTPYPQNAISEYSSTKAVAEQRVIAANTATFHTISVRLAVVWGPNDPLLPGIIRMAKRGIWIWPGGGSHTATQIYVSNATSGLIAAAIHGKPGEIYHLSDDERPTFKQLFLRRLRCCGCAPWQTGDSNYSRYLPAWLLWILVVICEFLWNYLPLRGSPPIPREGIAVATAHFSVSDAKARSKEHLGWRPHVSTEEGARKEGEWYKSMYS